MVEDLRLLKSMCNKFNLVTICNPYHSLDQVTLGSYHPFIDNKFIYKRDELCRSWAKCIIMIVEKATSRNTIGNDFLREISDSTYYGKEGRVSRLWWFGHVGNSALNTVHP